MQKPGLRKLVYSKRAFFVRKIVKRIKRFDYVCYVHEIRTFSCQRGAQFYTGYVVYRWIISLICLAIFITTLGDLTRPPWFKRDVTFYFKYFIYLTNLILTLLTVQTALGAIIVTRAILVYENRNPRFTDIKAKGIDFFYWKLHELSVNSALVLPLGYWLIMDRFMAFQLDVGNILLHAVSPTIAAADWLITGLPHNISDVWMGWICMICYFGFTIVYWIAGGYPQPPPLEKEPKTRAIYSTCTNYDDMRPVVCFMAITSVYSTCHIVLCLIYYLIRKCRPENQAVPPSR